MQRNKRSTFTADGQGVEQPLGLPAVREVADRIGRTEGLSRAGAAVVLAVAVARPRGGAARPVVPLVDGGDDFSAIEVLRGQGRLLGEVASDSTAWRRSAQAFLAYARQAGVQFSVSVRLTDAIRTAIRTLHAMPTRGPRAAPRTGRFARARGPAPAR